MAEGQVLLPAGPAREVLGAHGVQQALRPEALVVVLLPEINQSINHYHSWFYFIKSINQLYLNETVKLTIIGNIRK